MKDTNIEWCDSTVNPTGFQCQGCELWRPKQGVKECYAGRFAERIGGIGAFDKPVELKPGRMAEAARWSDLRGKARPGKPWIPAEYPRIIFIGDMADTFQRGVPFEYLFEEVIQNVVSEHWRRHIWMWLTKDAKRLESFATWLPYRRQREDAWPVNLWPGVSVTSNATTWRINHLLAVPAARRFISYEPAWEWVDFTPWMGWTGKGSGLPQPLSGALEALPEIPAEIHQIIIGGESGAGAALHPFQVEWARRLIQDCQDARVACFVKQLGAVQMGGHPALGWKAGSYLKHAKGGDWAEWPEDLRVREFPGLS